MSDSRSNCLSPEKQSSILLYGRHKRNCLTTYIAISTIHRQDLNQFFTIIFHKFFAVIFVEIRTVTAVFKFNCRRKINMLCYRKQVDKI
jgi:hypothetical protein